ncbi:MAG: CDP-glycerol glycerophosphotransferase family protein [Bacteroidaceae bacterium]
MENNHYLFFVSLTYAYAILRPLQDAVRKHGGEAAWYIEPSCPDLLTSDECRLHTFDEVKAFNPKAVFAPGNWIYDFFPGIKVEVFHGYPMRKRIEKIDDHFTIRGWFDIYCSQGESSTIYFKELEQKYGFFKIYETGWCKVDSFYASSLPPETPRDVPTILYAPTFTKGISSAHEMLPVITRLAAERSWNWIITFHPKLDDVALREAYSQLARQHTNVDFRKINEGLKTFRESDMLLCDSSSIIVEYMLLDKPVVTFRNTHPGDYLLDVQTEEDVGPAIEKALTRPASLMANMHRYTMAHEAHRDGKNSERVLHAVDHFLVHYQNKIKPKPLNLFRKLKLRWKLKYFRWTL